MARYVNDQKVKVVVFDADTKQIIQKNIVINTGGKLYEDYIVEILKDGVGHISAGYVTIGQGWQHTIEFLEDQITAIGYDYNSITGNVITAAYDPESGFHLYPWVVNIYMKKL